MDDWTSKDGGSNSSDKYHEVVAEIEATIYHSAHDLIHGNVNSVARLIASRLAHKHKMAPNVPKTPNPCKYHDRYHTGRMVFYFCPYCGRTASS